MEALRLDNRRSPSYLPRSARPRRRPRDGRAGGAIWRRQDDGAARDLGLTRPESGRIELDGTILFDAEAGIDVAPERRRVGFVFQDYALFPHMTVEQNVRYAGRERVNDLLERLGIAKLARAKPESLSGGERQRVGLARALARDPAVLLLDEPLSALDAHTRVTVRAELRELLEASTCRRCSLPTTTRMRQRSPGASASSSRAGSFRSAPRPS